MRSKTFISTKKVCTIYARYRTLLRLNKERRIYSHKDSYFSTGLLVSGFIDAIIIMPHPINYFEEINVSLPSLNQNPPINYKLNHLLSLYMTFRLALLVRIYLNCTIFRNSRSFRLW